MTKVTIVGLAGRVGKDAGNTAILKAALELLPENMELDIIEEGIGQQEPDEQTWGAHNAILFDERETARQDGHHTLHSVENLSDKKPESVAGVPTSPIEIAPGQDATRNPQIILSLHKIDMPQTSAVIARKKKDLNGPIANQKAMELIKSLLAELNSKHIA